MVNETFFTLSQMMGKYPLGPPDLPLELIHRAENTTPENAGGLMRVTSPQWESVSPQEILVLFED